MSWLSETLRGEQSKLALEQGERLAEAQKQMHELVERHQKKMEETKTEIETHVEAKVSAQDATMKAVEANQKETDLKQDSGISELKAKLDSLEVAHKKLVDDEVARATAAEADLVEKLRTQETSSKAIQERVQKRVRDTGTCPEGLSETAKRYRNVLKVERVQQSDTGTCQTFPLPSPSLGYGQQQNNRQHSPSPAAQNFGGGGYGGGGAGNSFQQPQAKEPDPVSPQIDGKAFFRAARGKLSSEAFNHFLASIKRLNNQQQTREETLDEARRLFGPENPDLYADFENLLNRQGGL